MLPRFYKNEDIRKRQINTLKIFNDNVIEVNEDSEYEIPFTAGEADLVLKVSLSSDFPSEKPVLKVVPPVIHHWVKADGTITAAPGLLNFTVHSDLGRVAQAIIREFQRNPPQPISSSVRSPPIPISEHEKNNCHKFQTFQTINNFSPPAHMSASTVVHHSIAFPELNSLTFDELNFLNENEDRQQEFIEELPHIQEQNKAIEDMILQITETAESNLDKQEQLKSLKEGIDLRIEEVTKLAFENERLNAIYQNLSDKYSPRNIQEHVRLAAETADKESEKVAEAFLDGSIDVEKFVSQFLKTKTLCQLRKTKEEKLCHQLDSLERAGF